MVTAHVVHRWLVDLVVLHLTAAALHHGVETAWLVSSYASAAYLLHVLRVHLIVTHLGAFLVNEVSLRVCQVLRRKLRDSHCTALSQLVLRSHLQSGIL